MATFAALVVGTKGHYEGMFQVVILDVLTYEDHDSVGVTRAFQKEYMKIQESFNAGKCMLVMFKHLTVTSKYDHFLKTESYTIVISVLVEEEREYLVKIPAKITNSGPFHENLREVCICVVNVYIILLVFYFIFNNNIFYKIL